MHAIRGAGRKIPVNLVLVAEGEEEVGSPNFPQIVLETPRVRAALEKSIGIFMPSHEQESDGSVLIALGSKGDIECDLVATGKAWGRGAGARRALEPRGAHSTSRPGISSRRSTHWSRLRATPPSTVSSSTCAR